MEGKLPTKILSKTGPTDLSTFTSAKVLALYFSAGWCGLCKELTPKLIKLYEEVNKTENQFQILFVSGDEGDKDFQDYYATMPWLAVPLDDDVVEELGEGYKVTSMPTLIIIDKNGKVLKEKAQLDFKGSKTPEEIFEDWKKLYA